MQCNHCGRYLKATAEYTVSPLDKVGREGAGGAHVQNFCLASILPWGCARVSA